MMHWCLITAIFFFPFTHNKPGEITPNLTNLYTRSKCNVFSLGVIITMSSWSLYSGD